MTNCPTCAQPLGKQDAVCRSCGRAVSHDATPISQAPRSNQEPPPLASATGKPAVSFQNKYGNRGQFWGAVPAALVGAGAGVILLVVINSLQGPARTTERRSNQADVAARAVPVSSSSQGRHTVPVMKWSQVKQSPWGRDGQRTIAFELPAEDDVPAWMKRVRPLLVVRCLSRNTEVFVITNSAASFERTAGQHTVHVGFDGGKESVEQWEDSVDSQQLFAPDGVGLARRIAEARTMTFRFTPFNSSPVTAEFNVTGFDEHVQAVAKTCQWREAMFGLKTDLRTEN